jgi:hypothetical protein
VDMAHPLYDLSLNVRYPLTAWNSRLDIRPGLRIRE